MRSDDDDARQRMFQLFDEAARVASRVGDRAMATLALGAAMLAARPIPSTCKKARPRMPSRKPTSRRT